MSGNTILIVLILIILLVFLAIFSKCNKWVNSIDSRNTQLIDNVRSYGRDNICKTAPSTPKTPVNSSINTDPIPVMFQETRPSTPTEIV